MDRDYQDGDGLRQSRTFWQVDTMQLSYNQAGEVYRKANEDWRPNGATERSASPGDIIVLPDGTVYSIAPVGFTLIREGKAFRD